MMQTEGIDDKRRQAAADNLERRRQSLKAAKRSKRKRLRLFIMLGLVLLLVLLLIAACTIHSRNSAKTSSLSDEAGKNAAGTDAGQTEQGALPPLSDDIVVGLKGSAIQPVLQGEPYIENGVYAIDKEYGAITENSIEIRGDVNTSVPGDYKIQYIAKGESGYGAAERTVRVMTEEDYGDKARNVPVMMYHWVYSEDDLPDVIDANWMLDTRLEEQLAWLSENEFYYPGWRELRAWVDDEISLPAKCAVVTFDDGKEAFLKHGVPLLEKYKVPATSFMICWEKNKGAEKIRKYASPYIDFESHSYAMHQFNEPFVNGHKGIMATMTKDEIKADLARAAQMLGSNDAFAYPYGDYTDDMVNAIREQGILCAFTVEYDRVRKGMDPMRLPRIRVNGNVSFEAWKSSIY